MAVQLTDFSVYYSQDSTRSVIDVLRKGVRHGPLALDLYHGQPSPGNRRAAELHAANIFSITRQLRYSKDATQLALDLCLFINGLPVATFELKNSLTKKTVVDAVEQDKQDRDPRELRKFPPRLRPTPPIRTRGSIPTKTRRGWSTIVLWPV